MLGLKKRTNANSERMLIQLPEQLLRRHFSKRVGQYLGLKMRKSAGEVDEIQRNA